MPPTGCGGEHDHRAAEGELGVVHEAGVGFVGVHGVAFEAEGGAQKFDGGRGVLVAQAGDDGLAHGGDAPLAAGRIFG
jgi:hypothetical protein